MRRLALAAVLLAACPRGATQEPPQELLLADFVVRDVRLFDGERVHERVSVAVRGATIVAVGPTLPVVREAEVIDGAGMTLLPGLIDAHTHVQVPSQLEQALVFGVTTELDMFTLPVVLKTARKRAAGDERRADLRSAGILATAPGGHGTEYGIPIPTLTEPGEAAAFVDARLAEGADYIKIVLDDGAAFGRPMPTLRAETVRALIDAAHARGKRAVVHVSSRREAIAALEAGADGLAHVFFDAPADPRFVALAKERGIFVADTLVVLEGLCRPGRAAALAEVAEFAPLLGPDAVRGLSASFPGGHVPKDSCEHARASVRALHAAGVPLLASTDAPNPGTIHGASLHDELALLVAAGLTPADALRAATAAPADAFGLDDRGRVAAGKRADLVLVRGDPTADVTATRRIVAVWKAGAKQGRDAWAAEVARERAELAALRAVPPPPGAESGVVADFEGGAVAAAFGAGWQPSTDALIGGTSTAQSTIVKGKGSKHALRLAGAVADNEQRIMWAGAMFFPGAEPMQPANLGKFKRIVFSARGEKAAHLTVMLFTKQSGSAPNSHELAITDKWATYRVEAAELGDLEWYDVMGLFFGATRPGPFALEIDDVRLE